MRHCERSEAIQEIFYGFYGLLRRVAPRNDGIRSRNKVRDHMSWCIPTATCHRGKPKVCPRSEKKAAFTLAEVLITLGVIGIVAAMTLPMLIEDYRKKEIPIRMKKFYSTIESAIQLAVLDNGDMQYWTYPVEQNDAESTSAFVKTYIFPYLTGIKECDAGDNKCKQFSTILYGGNHGDRMPIYVFLDGSCFGLVAGDSGAAGSQLHITYDYNCMGKPNEFDKDIFAFYIKGKPYGEKQYQFIAGNFPVLNANTREDLLDLCKRHTEDHMHGICSALIQYDGWEIKDDYPWW